MGWSARWCQPQPKPQPLRQEWAGIRLNGDTFSIARCAGISDKPTMPIQFNDPLFSAQWYLLNTGQRGGPSRLDINVVSAWERYTGKGIRVAVNDDGMDLDHPALVANLLADLAYDAGQGTTGAGFEGADNAHGTVVGSIVAMAGNDGIGGVGVAYEAQLIPGFVLAPEADVAGQFLANLAADADVSVNSWGQDPAFVENFGASGLQSDRDWGAALVRAASEGRDGLGMVIEVSGGNERKNNADTALSNFTGNKLTIAVGAVTETGAATDYSTRGASLLVTAFGGVAAGAASSNTGFGILSADIQGAAGYNELAGAAGDYSYQNEGTSYSGPMVGGAAALMLQANPRLGFRDVSTILALTARKVDPANNSWVQNHAPDWNLGGMHFSRDFGYGLIDVSAAVRLAESWTGPGGTYANWKVAEGASNAAGSGVPDNSATGLTVTADVQANVRIERMEFDLNLRALNPSQLSAVVTSPGGTRITLFDQPLTRSLADGEPDMSVDESPWPETFTIGSTSFLGESSAGRWTLRLTDHVTGDVATFNSLSVRAWGSAISADSQYVFTNEFSARNAVFSDAAGTDTLNAAALEGAASIDLREGQVSLLGTGQFTVAPGSVLEHAIGGSGSDSIRGNSAHNVLRGNAGNDSLDGGAGVDVAYLRGPASNYRWGLVSDQWRVSDATGADGTDTLLNIERLHFGDKKLALDLAGHAGVTAKVIGAVLGAAAVGNPNFVGIGLSYTDQGMSYADLGSLALNAVGATTPDAIVSVLWANVVGSVASEADKAPFIALLADGMKPGDLVVLAGNTALNTANINLVGLSQTGIEYLLVG